MVPVKEVEPNDDILHPNVLTLGTAVRAEIRPVTDKDFFHIRTPAGAPNEVRVVVSNRSKLMQRSRSGTANSPADVEYSVSGESI